MKKIMKFSFILLVLSFLLIGFENNKVAQATSQEFKDVPTTHIYHKIIVEMANRSIITGYEDGTFKPSETITRKHAAALINRAVVLPKAKEFKQPNDLSTQNAYYNDLKALIQADLLKVDAKGNINPNEPLKRSEMAKILVVAFNLTGSTSKTFTDVPSTHEFYSYINTLYANNITTGENGKYMPEKMLSRAHFAVFMNRAIFSKEIEEISSETQIDTFNKVIKTNSLFDLSKEYEANEHKWEFEEYRAALTEGQKLLEGTDFKYISISPFIMIQEPTWKPKNDFLSAQIVITASDTRSHLSFDHLEEGTTEKAIEFANLLFPEYDLEEIIRTKVTEGLEAYNGGDKEFRNGERLNINNHTVKIGVAATNQYSYFAIDIMKQ